MFPFACKQNMNLRPIEQIRFPRKRNTLFTENPIFENYVEFCRQNNANSQAVCHIPYKNIAHTAQPTTPPCPTFRPVRRSAASRSRLRRCGGVRKRERAACSAFYFTLFQPFPSQGTHLYFAIPAHLREAARRRTLQNNGPTRGLSCAPLQTRPRGGRRGFCWLGSASVSGDPTTRRANAADGARESALDKPSRLLYTHTGK